MNKRIRELAEQAKFQFECHTCGESPYDMQQFAELIIQECVLQCVHDEDMDLIKQHFGVHP